MSLNLELKQEVRSHDRIRARLKEIGAEFKTFLNQRDVYFVLKGSLLKLRIMDQRSELIKYNRNEDGGTRWSDYSVMEINDINAEEFLSKIFDVEVIVTKQRELWMYDNTRVHLDVVNSLGSFIELETLVLSGKEDAQKRFDNIMKLLDLSLENQLLTSYRDLLLNKDRQ